MKKTTLDLMFLNAVFVLGLILSNLFGGKLIGLRDMIVPGAVLTYPLTFLSTDVIGEVWGKKEADGCVKMGFIAQILFLALGHLSLMIPAQPQCEELQECLTVVLNQGVRMTLASMVAFAVSQPLDVYIFHRLKDKCHGKHRWLRNNGSTMISQLFDTVIFITIAFYGVVDEIVLMVSAQYMVKLALALLDTPFFYLFSRRKVDWNIQKRTG